MTTASKKTGTEVVAADELFEITTVAANDQFVVKLNTADGEPLLDKKGVQLSVTVYGPGSKVYAKATAARTQRMMDRMAKRGRLKMTSEQQRFEGASFLATVTISFNGWGYKGANDETAIHAAYLDTSLGYIADQVQAAVDDWANFTKPGATS